MSVAGPFKLRGMSAHMPCVVNEESSLLGSALPQLHSLTQPAHLRHILSHVPPFRVHRYSFAPIWPITAAELVH